MSDPTNPDAPLPSSGSTSPTPSYPTAPTPPPAPVGQWPTPSTPPPDATGGTPPPPAEFVLQPVASGGGRRKLAIGAIAAVILGAGAYASTQLTSDESGAGSPEEAGEQLLAAITASDVLGVIDLLPPGERELFLDMTDELSNEGDRLGLLDESFRLDGFPGVTIEVTDPEFEVEELSPGLANVALVEGEASVEVDGALVVGTLGEVIEEITDVNDIELEAPDSDGQEDIGDLVDEAEGEAEEFGGEAFNPFTVTVIEQDGRWYPSLGFTIAESTRRSLGVFDEDGLSAPDLTDGIAPEGASSPEEAIQALLDAATGVDAEAAIAVLDPEEMGALQVYSEIFLDGLGDGEDTGITAELTDADVTELSDGVNRVVPTGVRVEGDVDGTSFEFELADDCTTLVTESDDADIDDFDFEFCAGDDLADSLPDGLGELGEAFEDLEIPEEIIELIEAFEPIEAGIITVERDGEHFVSPIRTFVDYAGVLYRGLERADLEEGGIVFEALTGGLDDEFEDLSEVIAELLGTQVEETFTEVGDTIDSGDFEDFEDELGEAVPVPTPTGPGGPGGEIIAGDVVSGTFAAGGEANHTVIATGGEAFIGAVATNGADLTISVVDVATGEELGFNDDFFGTDPEVFLTLTEGQMLLVTVREFTGGGAEFFLYYEL